MPTILTKRSNTPGAVPATADLTNAAGGAELAVNTADKRLFTINSSSAVVEIGTNPSSLTVADLSATVLRAGSATITNLIGNSLTISSGTANGVLYLNASKVATSGTALVFDGTSLGVGESSPTNPLSVKSDTSAQVRVGTVSTNVNARITLAASGTGLNILGGSGAAPLAFYFASSELMRLDTSTIYTASGINVGIGTSSPTAKLHVKDTTGTAVTLLNLESGYSNPSGNKSILWTDATSALGRISISYTAATGSTMSFGSLYNGGYQTSDLMVLTNAGNLGLGVTPSAWASTVKGFQIGGNGSIADNGAGGHTDFSNNVYYAVDNITTGARYINNGYASNYYQATGQHVWRTAASGTAGNTITFTQAMTLDASGNLLLGTTTAHYATSGRTVLNINGSTSSILGLQNGNDTAGYLYADSGTFVVSTEDARSMSLLVTGSAVMTFGTNNTERARITSGGDFVVNSSVNAATLNTNAKLSVWNTSGSGDAKGLATGYGTTNGQFRLIYLNSAADALNFDNGNNNASLTSGGTWTNASDARLKKSIVDIKYGLDAVVKSKPRSFERVDVDGEYIGFIAQELLDVVPEVVYGSEEQKYSVDYGSLVAVAFKAIQEQQAMINDLKAKVAALESK